MASSRLEKIGTIFTRLNGLLKTGAMKWEDRPLWYDIYTAFPPKDEPRYDRPAPDIPVKAIFYDEDAVRALYHKNTKNLGTINMFNNESQTKTQKFIEIYRKLENTEHTSGEHLYENAIQMLSHELEKQAHEGSITDNSSIANAFKEAKDQQKPKVDVTNIFKE